MTQREENKWLAVIPQGIDRDSFGEIPTSSLNPFQLHLFLNFNKYYDDFVRVNANRAKIYGPNKVQFDFDKEAQSIERMLEDEETYAATGIAYSLLDKAAAFMAFAVSGDRRCEPFAEACIRGVLGVDHDTYQEIYQYFSRYTLSLNLTDESEKFGVPNDSRFMSNRRWFGSLDATLFGPGLSGMKYPNAQKYSDVAYEKFRAGAIGRVKKVMQELNF